MKIGVLGAGSWGTALALAVSRAGHLPILWGRDARHSGKMEATRRNERYLPEVDLPVELNIASTIDDAANCPVVLCVVPAQVTRETLSRIKGFNGTMLVCSKGIERHSSLRMSELAQLVLPDAQVGLLSGPSFAGEVARELPTALVCGLADAGRAAEIAALLSSRCFRLYPSTDLVGIDIGGALKNVVAIAAGAVIGRGLGENARAAVVTRGLAELTRLAIALGAQAETMAGLSGLGDLTLTATSLTSRNTRFGHELGRGVDVETLRSGGAKLSEGAWTADAALELARRHHVSLPITEAVADVLEGRTALEAAIERLTSRPLASRE